MKRNSLSSINAKQEKHLENTTPNKDNQSSSDTNNKPKREVSLALELFTRIIKKEDQEKCICHPLIEKAENVSFFHENEFVTGIQISQNPNNLIKFEEVISGLRLMGYPLTGSLISVYCSKIDDFIYLGAEPLDANLVLDSSEFDNLNFLRVKITAFIEEKLLINQTAFAQIFEENQIVDKNNLSSFTNNNLKNNINNSIVKVNSNKNAVGIKENKKPNSNKRTKERKIGYIIEKVNTWRKYYNGYYDEKGNFTKFSLDEAAKKIDISKKSLDDYLLQLRLGRKYGFDFNLHKNDKVGILRAFVKEKRKKMAD